MAYFYKLLWKCGIRDVNTQNAFVDARLADKFSIQQSALVLSSKSVQSLMRWLTRGKDAESTITLLKRTSESENEYMFNDTAQMYLQLAAVDALTEKDRTGSIQDIHDRLAAKCIKLKTEYKTYQQSDREKAMNADINGFRFKPAADSDELINIGSQMHNCVSTYNMRAFAKKCTIVSVSNSAERYVACIEVHNADKNPRLVQLKGVCNTIIHDSELGGAIAEWVRKNKIAAENCSDFQLMRKAV